jgi:hypothetical protein
VVVCCDRGLRRVRWLEHLQERRHAFVVRLMSDVMVTTGSRGARRLRAWRLHLGQAVELGMVSPRRARRRVGIHYGAELGLQVSIGVRCIWTPLPLPRLRHFPWRHALEAIPESAQRSGQNASLRKTSSCEPVILYRTV